jgi:hypothetical protein
MALTIGLVAAAITAALSPLAIGGTARDQLPTILPTDDILASVRAMGLNPKDEPVRRGRYYVLHAYKPTGAEVRVVADAQFGDVVSVRPTALSPSYVPGYRRGARIIQIPQPGDYDEDSASVDRGDAPVPPKPHTAKPRPEKPRAQASAPRTTPRWKLRSDSPPPPPPTGPRRAVLSAPPPLAAGPTPLRPTPKFGAKADAAEKFASPAESGVAADAPPRGYTPPTAPEQR